jgi:uncharacterized protein YndB with AHSA1/START domain
MDTPLPHPGELVSTRRFPFPPRDVYAAFADPRRLARWWGPDGFTNTIVRFEPHPGGAFELVMHGPDGAAFHNDARFVAVEPGHRVVFDHLQPMHGFRMEMSWVACDGGTELTWRMAFVDAAELARLRDFLAVANEQNFDRLGAHLAAAAVQP